MPRVIAIYLDAYDQCLGEKLMRDGLMPAMHALAQRSARFTLDHGSSLRTGLAGEHFATGLAPQDSGRWAAVHFDPETYEIWQEGTSMEPFPAQMPQKTVVFDAPYFDITRAPAVQGIVNWGAHDPGVPLTANPAPLIQEIEERFGPYPARRWIYGLPWSSVDDSREMGERLTDAIHRRADIAEWLLAERLPDWDLAIISVSEAHSVIEGLWHGVDETHPLHIASSAKIAGEGVRNVYRGIDRLIARLTDRFPDATVVMFSMHGMGQNRSDAPSLLLLAEALYRHRFHKPLFDRNGEASPALNDHVAMAPGERWVDWVAAGFPARDTPAPSLARRIVRRVARMLPGRSAAVKPGGRPSKESKRLRIDWIPATRYRPYWPEMRAFALPSYYDGRVRINLEGRERDGVVRLNEYEAERQRITEVIEACRDTVTGEPVVEAVEFAETRNPMELGPTEADLIFVWRGAAAGFVHPELGQMGPVPYRRTGGHTKPAGFAYIAGSPLAPADYGTRSAFDIVPTLIDLLSGAKGAGNAKVSGNSLLGPAAPAEISRGRS